MNSSKFPISTSLLIPLIAIFGMMAIGYGLFLFAPANLPATFVGPDSPLLPSAIPVAPKPGDRFMFQGIIGAVPFLLLVTGMLAKRSRENQFRISPTFWMLVAGAAGIAVLRGALAEIAPLFDKGQWSVTLTCFILATVLVLYHQGMASRDRVIFWPALALSGIILCGLRLRTLHNIDYGGAFTSHFEAIAFPPLRIAEGGTCLADVIPQYGCYGEYLAPLLRLFSSSTLAVTGIFLILQIVAAWIVLAFAKSAIRRPSLLVACILCLFVEIVLNLWPAGDDPIRQYYPVRFLFPALSLPVIGWLQRSPSWHRALPAGIFAGLAVTWNLETGLAVFVALAIFVTMGSFTLPPWADFGNFAEACKRGLAYTIGAVFFMAAFLAYLYLKSGATISLAGYFIYQTVFYFTGFGMIPIPPFPDYWTIHAGLLLSTLILATVTISRGPVKDRILEQISYLAVLAIGLSLYYSGRSHWLVLKLVAWPDAILFFYLAGRAMDEAKGKISQRAFGLLQVIAVSALAAFLAFHAPAVWEHSIIPRTGTTKTEVEQDAAFISSKALPGERVYILALNQGTLYGATGTRPAIKGPGLAEMIRKIDLARAKTDIATNGPPKLFVGLGLEKASRSGQLGTDIAIDFAALHKHYALAARGPGDRVLYFTRKPYIGDDLFDQMHLPQSPPQGVE